MSDETQTTLYAISPSDLLKRIDERRKAWVIVNRDIAKNLEARKELRRKQQKAYAEFLEATGGGVQESIEDEEDEDHALHAAAGEVVTANAHSEKRRATIVAGALRVLKAAGGRMANTDLAAYLRLDPHGVAGYLAGSEAIRKEYNGRVGNGKLEWVLADEAGAA